MRALLSIVAAGLFWAGTSGQALAQNAVLTVSDAKQSVELTNEQLGKLKQEKQSFPDRLWQMSWPKQVCLARRSPLRRLTAIKWKSRVSG